MLDDMISEIRQLALQIADDRTGQMLLIAEMEYGAISADMFYLSASDVVLGRACPKKLLHLIYEFWKAWRDDAERRE